MAKVDVSKLTVQPVPAGFTMKYQHFYKREGDKPPVLEATEAWLCGPQGDMVASGTATVNPKDVAIKKLGRIIAHNRCIKTWKQQQATWTNPDQSLGA